MISKIGWWLDLDFWYQSFFPNISLFHATGLPIPLKKKQSFSDIFREYRKRPAAWNSLMTIIFKMQITFCDMALKTSIYRLLIGIIYTNWSKI